MQRYGMCTLLLLGIVVFGCRPRVGSERALQDGGFQAQLPRSGKQFVQQPIPGRYVGFSKALQVPTERFLPTTADLALYGVNGERLRYVAVIRLSLGSHTAAEYLSFYTDQIYFNNSSGELELPSVHEGPYELRFNEIEGEGIGFSVWRDGERLALGKVKLFQGGRGPALEAKKTSSSVSGSYRSSCRGEQLLMQLELLPDSLDGPIESSFPGYILTGRIGQWGRGCSAQNGACVQQVLTRGDFDPFKGSVRFVTRNGLFQCNEGKDGLDCGACQFNMVESDHEETPILVFPRTKTVLGGNHFEEKHGFHHLQSGGRYSGLLHHESHDRYQAFELDVQPGGKAVTVRLKFGGELSATFKLKEIDLEPAIGHAMFDGEGNGFLSLVRVTPSEIIGVWYSKTYGRVGSVEISKTSVFEPGSEISLAGVYSGEHWRYQLVGAAGLSKHPKDRFPVAMTGWVQNLGPGGLKQKIARVFYDPYSFNLAMATEIGQAIWGEVSGTGHRLYWTSEPTFGLALKEMARTLYQK